jgi:Fe(3+) dicitrate transport protein
MLVVKQVVSVAKLTSFSDWQVIFFIKLPATINESSDGGLRLSIGGRGLNRIELTLIQDKTITIIMFWVIRKLLHNSTEALNEIQLFEVQLLLRRQFGGLVEILKFTNQ